MSQPQSNPDGAWTATIANNLAGLKQGLDALGRWLKNHAVGRETDDRAHLVFEEIVNNIIRHGFEDNREHPIRVGARMDGEELTLTFDDEGRPFDPSSAPEFRRHAGTRAHRRARASARAPRGAAHGLRPHRERA